MRLPRVAEFREFCYSETDPEPAIVPDAIPRQSFDGNAEFGEIAPTLLGVVIGLSVSFISKKSMPRTIVLTVIGCQCLIFGPQDDR
ncbi:MAG: hypothetical protein WBD20_05285 [Pirellulaceae bacterium]